MNQTKRNGILAAGNFITDYVKIIDEWPEQDMLVNIVSESMSNGGGPYNVLKDLAALAAPFPLEAAGLLGDDANGRQIRTDCSAHGINASQLCTTTESATSYTDAMCVETDGRRTFFHQRGANSLFSREHVDLNASNAKIFLLGYLLLIDAMDRLDDDGSTEASRLLKQARSLGFITAVETVSTKGPSFREVVIASLQHADIFFSNEVEAALVLGTNADSSAESMRSAAEGIAELGSPGRVIIHSAHGAVCRDPNGNLVTQSALNLPSDFIRGSSGAGDGFTSGFLYGVHDTADTKTCLLQGVCVAAQTLTDPTPSGGVLPLVECMKLAEQYGFQDF